MMIEMQNTSHQVQSVQANFDRAEAMVSVFVPYGSICVPAQTFARLDEWAGWVRVRMSLDSHGRCASAEGRYDSAYPDAERGMVAIEHDLVSVLAVERVVCTRLPLQSREIIKRHFVLRDVPQSIARSMGIHRAQYGNELKRSVLMVRNNLTRS
jgi:hypothetical protein